MWLSNYDLRLRSWVDLRNKAIAEPLNDALARINDWWFTTNWEPYNLHWDDIDNWPDPWQLLQDNRHCDLARGLGILYTITIIDRPDIKDAALINVDDSNLVLVNKEKYILNSEDSIKVNIHSTKTKKALKCFTIDQAKAKIN